MTRAVRIYRTTDLDRIRELDKLCFPGEKIDARTLEKSAWFILNFKGWVAGYAGAWPLQEEAATFLSRAGVLHMFRGEGLQRSLIRARVRFAESIGSERAVTYTVPDNVASSNNLIRCGFRLYRPENPWVGDDCLYWMKRFHTDVQDSSD